MREIKFRGQRVDTNEWVYGYLSKGRMFTYKGKTLQPCIDYEEKGVMLSSVVIPETVGQYTGFKDINGKDIYEGDIVKWLTSDREIVKSEVVYVDGAFRIYNMAFTLSDYITNGIEIVGNIHDEPEMMYPITYTYY